MRLLLIHTLLNTHLKINYIQPQQVVKQLVHTFKWRLVISLESKGDIPQPYIQPHPKLLQQQVDSSI